MLNDNRHAELDSASNIIGSRIKFGMTVLVRDDGCNFFYFLVDIYLKMIDNVYVLCNGGHYLTLGRFLLREVFIGDTYEKT